MPVIVRETKANPAEFMEDDDGPPKVQIIMGLTKAAPKIRPTFNYFYNKQTMEISTALEPIDIRNYRGDSRYREITEQESLALKNILETYQRNFPLLFNKHPQEDIHILANGPSLTQYGYNILWNDLITIGINAAPLFFSMPTYWLLIDQLYQPQRPLFKWLIEWYERNAGPFTTTILNEASVDLLNNIRPPDHCFKSTFRGTSKNNLYWYGSSTHAAIDLAMKMGTKQIFLWGVDYNDRGHFYTGVIKDDPLDQPHEQWANYEKHVQGFETLRAEAKKQGVVIFNCNPESKLDVFTKINPQEVFKEMLDPAAKEWVVPDEKTVEVQNPEERAVEQIIKSATYNFTDNCLELRDKGQVLVIPFEEIEKKYLLQSRKVLMDYISTKIP